MKLFNTIKRKKEEFIPIDKNNVKMYSCGPTVYNYFHIGNARPFIIFDTLRRYLEYIGYKVTFVQNFTDIDDKMIKNAKKENITIKELAEKYINEYFVDSKGLRIKEATFHPRATENIDSIIEIIKTLEEKGFAYNVEGDVYFSTNKFEGYGKLSHRNFDELKVGVRNFGEKKKDDMDFALWKAQKPDEPAWESPWGLGRPGWHIECSAMSMKLLGETIDIHSGGQDLIFPHHENEIAQSEACTGKPFANYWIHNGFINVDNEKMAKSKGNFFTVRDVAQIYDYVVIRFFMLSAHYRSPINYAPDLMEQAKNGLDRIYTCINNLNHLKTNLINSDSNFNPKLKEYLENSKSKFREAMDDDLNTSGAIASIFDLVRDVNSYFSNIDNFTLVEIEESLKTINELTIILGIEKIDTEEISNEVLELVEMRKNARINKEWKKSDELRNKINDLGYIVEDTPNGMKVRKK